MIFGYARVSSIDQNLDRQIDALEKFGCEEIVVEKESGVVERPEFEKLLKEIRRKDVIVCEDLTRFGRSQLHILQVINELKEKKAGLITLKERIDTREENPYSDLIISIFAATAEFERKIIKETQREGILRAKSKGKYKGKQRKYHKEARKPEDRLIYEEIVRLLQQGIKKVDISDKTGVSRPTINKIEKELMDEIKPKKIN
ncbi:recombinase family protein [Margalitia sp. FSL K6-0131]|uniref:recombinase family protein n=1 Tax=Margalitia sp. FSL K6-0131 TaxID=2954604 RepID=UPI0030FBB3AD